jgi:hypothetical protein
MNHYQGLAVFGLWLFLILGTFAAIWLAGFCTTCWRRLMAFLEARSESRRVIGAWKRIDERNRAMNQARIEWGLPPAPRTETSARRSAAR